MESHLLFLLIAGLLNFAAFIWLLITAFKRSIVWGLLVFFFSPLTALLFAITNWYDAKKPFLAYLLTTILMLIPIYMMMSAANLQNVQRVQELVDSGEIQENEAVEYLLNPELLEERERAKEQAESGIVVDEAGEPVPGALTSDTAITGVENSDQQAVEQKADVETEVIVEEKEPSPYPKTGEVKPDPLQVKKKEAVKDSVKVSVSKIGNYKGRYFIVTTKSGTQHRGILVSNTDSRIVLERKIYGGTFTYKILKSKIKTIDMLKKEYVEEVNPK